MEHFGATRELPAALVAGYAYLTRAAISGDRRAVRAACRALDFFDGSERGDRAEGFLDLLILAAEAVVLDGDYDPAFANQAGVSLRIKF